MRFKKSLCLLSIFLIISACSSREDGIDYLDTSDISASTDSQEDNRDAVSDVFEDIEICNSEVVGLYGPYNKIETSLPPELFPFPNDYYTVFSEKSPTGIRLSYPQDVFLNGVNELMGFPTFSILLARFVLKSAKEGEYAIIPIVKDRFNKRSIAEDSVFLLPLDVLMNSDNIEELERSLLPVEIHSNRSGILFVQANKILDEDREYVFFITNRLKVRIEDGDGRLIKDEECISTTPNFEAIKSRRSVEARFPDLEPYRISLVPIFDRLEERLHIDRKDIIMFSRFRTGKNVSIMRQIKDDIDKITDFNVEIVDVFKPLNGEKMLTEKMREYLPCAEDIKSIDEFYDYDFTNVDSIVVGYYDSPYYLNENNRLNYDPDKKVYLPTRTDRVQFIIILPAKDPDKGLIQPSPFVLFQHAFQVCKETSLALAGTFTSFGFSIGGIDMMGHGVRAGRPRCADGRLFCDTQSLDFIKVNDLISTVNWLRQSAIDTIAFYKMLKGLRLDVVPSRADKTGRVIREESGDGINDIDSNRLLFTSQSLGSYLGISIVSLVNDFRAALFNVPAAAFYKMLSMELSDNGNIWELKDMYIPFILSVQTLVDEIEVLNFTKLYFIEGGVNMNVMVQVAKDDGVVPPSGTEMLGHFMGLEQVDALRIIEGVPQYKSPHWGSYHSENLTAAYYQFDPAEHIFYLKSRYEGVRESAQYQSAVFLKSSLERREKGGLVINPYSCSQIDDFIQEAKGYPLEIGSNPFCE